MDYFQLLGTWLQPILGDLVSHESDFRLPEVRLAVAVSLCVSHVVAEANERRLYSQASLAAVRTQISFTSMLQQTKQVLVVILEIETDHFYL